MAVIESLGRFSGDYLFTTVFILPLLYIVSLVIYRLYFHPLSRFPGPLLHRISILPFIYKHTDGTLPFDMLTLHETYGNIVRIAPNELAVSHPDAWNDLMGHSSKSSEELRKATWFYEPFSGRPKHIINESREQHGRLRRTMAHGFSEKAMREQEPVIGKYVDLLISKLRERSSRGESVSIGDWYNFCTFDVIGDLAFGETFGCLEQSGYNVWVKGIISTGRVGTVLQALSFMPALKWLMLQFVPRKIKEESERHKALTREKMLRRIQVGEGRSDLIEGLLAKKEELNLSVDELVANAEILIIGGSETTASLLSGVTYYLLMNPDALAKVTEEVRASFESEVDINIISVNKLTYMLACLNEGLRMYPPVANGLPREIPARGAKVLGEYIPGGSTIAQHQWALYRRSAYWHKPNEFHPERFLGSPEFASDRRDALQPFHVGPRNCLGRNLAYSEMRLILAKVIWNFDMKIMEEAKDWVDQRHYLMWKKGELRVWLEERGGAM